MEFYFIKNNMKRVTANIVNDAKRMLGMWRKASKDVGAVIDNDFQLRETASVLGVDYETLKKRLKKDK